MGRNVGLSSGTQQLIRKFFDALLFQEKRKDLSSIVAAEAHIGYIPAGLSCTGEELLHNQSPVLPFPAPLNNAGFETSFFAEEEHPLDETHTHVFGSARADLTDSMLQERIFVFDYDIILDSSSGQTMITDFSVRDSYDVPQLVRESDYSTPLPVLTPAAVDTVVAAAPTGVAVIRYRKGQSVQLVAINEILLAILGYSRFSDIPASDGIVDALELVLQEDRPYSMRKLLFSVDQRLPTHAQVRLIRSSGSWFWARVMGRTFLDSEGQKVYLLLVSDASRNAAIRRIFDIRDMEMSSHQDELSRLYEVVKMGIVKVVANERLDLIFSNGRFFSLLGYPPSGKTIQKFSSLSELVHPADIAILRAQFRITFTAAETHSEGFKLRFRRADGIYSWLRMDMVISERPNVTKGDPPVFFGIVTPMDDMGPLENHSLSRQFLTTLLATSTGAGGMITSLEEPWAFRFIEPNMKRLLGHEESDDWEMFLSRDFASYIMPEDLPEVRKKIKEGAQENSPVSLEFRIRRQDGHIIFVRCTVRRATDDNNDPVLTAVVMDHTPLKKTEARLRMEQERTEKLLGLMGGSTWNYEPGMDIASTLDITEISQEDMDSLEHFLSSLDSTPDHFPSMEIQVRRSGDTQMRWYRIEAVPLQGADGTEHAIGRIHDVQEEHERALELEKAKRQDNMTGLLNKRYMQDAVDQLLTSVPEKSNAAFCLLDIDNFKEINDKIGHLFGDAVLTEITRVLVAQAGAHAVIGRIGGDEFALFLPNTSARTAQKICLSISTHIKKLYVGELQDVAISASIGVAMYPINGISYLQLFRNADKALYAAKQSGKNTLTFTSSISDIFPARELLNTYTREQPRTVTSQDEEFLEWAMELISATKDLGSAIQLLLTNLCTTYNLDHAFIAEFSSDRNTLTLPYVHDRQPGDAPFKKYDAIPVAIDIFTENADIAAGMPRLLTNEDLNPLCMGDSLSKTAWCKSMDKYRFQYLFIGDKPAIAVFAIYQDDISWTCPPSLHHLLVQLRDFLLPSLVRKKDMDESMQDIQQRLNYDTLTGLPVMSHFKHQAATIIGENPSEHFYILYGDIRNFKYVNDTVGVTEGDKVLMELAHLLQDLKTGRQKPLVSRFFDDNFAMLISAPSFRVLHAALMEVLNKQTYKLREQYDGMDIFFSFGAAEVSRSSRSVEEAIDNANIARKKSKQQHGNICKMFDSVLANQIATESRLMGYMNSALENKEFIIYLQPKFLLKDRCLIGAEALVRWKHEGQILMPGDFVPYFERNGFITKVDMAVLEQVLAFQKKWLEQSGRAIPISVNLSRAHVANDEIVEKIDKLAKAYRIPARLLEFELTETAFAQNMTAVKRMLASLQRLGYMVSIDDFGSGYSSLSLLSSVPADIIKLDRSLLQKDSDRFYSKVVLRHLIEMAQEMGFYVICEGVETEKQVALLSGMGCTMGQGYLFAKPMPLEDFEQAYAAQFPTV